MVPCEPDAPPTDTDLMIVAIPANADAKFRITLDMVCTEVCLS